MGTWDSDRLFGIPETASIRQDYLDPFVDWMTAIPSWGEATEAITGVDPSSWWDTISGAFRGDPEAEYRSGLADFFPQEWPQGRREQFGEQMIAGGPANPDWDRGEEYPFEYYQPGWPGLDPYPEEEVPGIDAMYAQLFDMMRDYANEAHQSMEGRFSDPDYVAARESYLDSLSGGNIYQDQLDFFGNIESMLMQNINDMEALKSQGIESAYDAQMGMLAEVEKVRGARLGAEETALLARLGELEAARAEHDAASFEAISQRMTDALARRDARIIPEDVDPARLATSEMGDILTSQQLSQEETSQRMGDLAEAGAIDREMGLRRGFSDARARLADLISSGRWQAATQQEGAEQALAEAGLMGRQRVGIGTMTSEFEALMGQATRDADRAKANFQLTSTEGQALFDANTDLADSLHEINILELEHKIDNAEAEELKAIEAERAGKVASALDMLGSDNQALNNVAFAMLGELTGDDAFATTAVDWIEKFQADSERAMSAMSTASLLQPGIARTWPGGNAPSAPQIATALIDGDFAELMTGTEITMADLAASGLSMQEINDIFSKYPVVAQVLPKGELPGFLAADMGWGEGLAPAAEGAAELTQGLGDDQMFVGPFPSLDSPGPSGKNWWEQHDWGLLNFLD